MANYYVATNGNNGWAGTIGSPWRDLNYAVSQISPGDIVYVRGGTYAERLTVSISASSGFPILFEGYQSETAVIGNGVVLTGDYITVNKFDIEQTSGATRIVMFDGATYCEVSNLPDMTTSSGSVGFIGGAANNTFRDAVCIGGGPPHWAAGTSDNLVKDGSFTGITSSGYLRGQDNTLEDCTIVGTNNGTDLYYPKDDGQTVRGCVIYNFSRTGAEHTDLFQIWNESLTNFTVENCVLGSDNRPGGDQDPSNAVFMMSSDDMDEFSGMIIRNNIIFGGGWFAAIIGGTEPITDCELTGNICFNGIKGSLGVANRRGWVVKNNIFIMHREVPPDIGSVGPDGPGDGGAVFDYNMYWKTSVPGYEGSGSKEATPLFVDDEISASTAWGVYADWRPTASSPVIDCGSSAGTSVLDKDGNPRYDDPATENTGGGTYTYYDIGAYEYQGTGEFVLLAGTSNGGCTSSAILNYTTALSGQSNGGSSASSSVYLPGIQAVAGQSDGGSTASASLGVTKKLSGQSNGTSTITMLDFEFIAYKYPESDADTNASLTYYPSSPETHWDKLDDPWGAADDDSTYVIHLSNDTYVTVDSSDFTIPSGSTINAVRIKFRIKKVGAESIWPVTSLMVGDNWFSSGQCNPAQGVWTDYYIDYFVNPDTNQPWTVDQINGIGTSALSTFGWYVSDADPDVYFTQVSVRVLYNKAGKEYLAGQSDGGSTASATVTTEGTVNLSGTANGGSTASAYVHVAGIQELAGQSDGSSTTSASLYERFSLATTVELFRTW